MICKPTNVNITLVKYGERVFVKQAKNSFIWLNAYAIQYIAKSKMQIIFSEIQWKTLDIMDAMKRFPRKLRTNMTFFYVSIKWLMFKFSVMISDYNNIAMIL